MFRITPDGTYTVVHGFTRAEGSYPRSGLVQTSDGTFYGLTSKGGRAHTGTFYKLTMTDTVITASKIVAPEGTPAAQVDAGSTKSA